jgi:cell division protein FtsI/penicillin-binding protein 2
MDIYLTIDPVIQKEILSRTRYYQQVLVADGIAVTLIDPHTGKIKAMVNYPEYNANTPADYYKLRPLTYDERYLVENETYIDIPIFILSGDDLRQAFLDERNDPQYQKYVFENLI